MYDPKKRHKRYMNNAEIEREQAIERYNNDSDNINTKRRAEYQKNIEINREKLRLRQAERRRKLKLKEKCQNDTSV